MSKRLFIAAVVCALGISVSASATDLDALLFPLTGEIQLKNASGSTVPLVFYSINSAAGTLNGSPSVWTSITRTYDAPFAPTPGNGYIDPNGSWVEFPATSTQLAEGALDVDGGSLLAGRSVSLGQVWNTITNDLIFDIRESNFGPAINVTVKLALAGDYFQDGVVNLADYSVWRQNFGSTTNFDADGNLDGVVNGADYTIWRNNFGTQLPGAGGGSGSGAGLGLGLGGTVPEPSSVILMLAALGASFLSPHRRRRF